jgi:biotin carboxyl carrier protein
MEIPVIAESAGVVSRLHVARGDVIRADDLIAVID